MSRTPALILALVASLIAAPVVEAQQSTASIYTAYNNENLTVDDTAGGVGFSTTIINQPNGLGKTVGMVSFRVVCASSSPCAINVLYDGSAPSTTVGVNLNEGDIVNLYGTLNIKMFKAIRSGANSAVLRVIYHYY